jgi:hypothetical protein
MKSPFQFGKIVAGRYFTNRDNEIKRLISNFDNHINTILISPRRWGKSSLVKNASEIMVKKLTGVRFCFIDLFQIRDEKDFYTTFARETIKATSRKTDEWLYYINSFFKRIKPRISFSNDPINDFEITFDFNDKADNYEEILNLPEKISRQRGFKIIICIDEFQNLSHFNDPLLFQKRLRTTWQHHHHTTYCLYGSKPSMLTELFENRSMPFYKFGDVFYMEKIEKHSLQKFILKNFKRTKKIITKIQVEKIVDWMQCHPYYVQQLSHLVWINTESFVTEQILQSAFEDLINQNALLFEREVESLSNTQIYFLKALVDGVQDALSSKAIIHKFKLGTSANVVKVKKALERKEIIDIIKGKPVLVDPAFEHWFKKVYQIG